MAKLDPLPKGWVRSPGGYAISPEVRQYLPAALSSGVSMRSFLAAFRSAGFSVGNQAAADYARTVLKGFRTAGLANRSSNTTVITHGEFAQQNVRFPLKYRVVGELNLGDFTINDRSRFSGFSLSNKLLTLGEHKQAIFTSLEGFIQKYAQQLQEAGIELSPDDISFTTFESFLD